MASSLIGTQAPSFGVLKDQHGRPFDSANAFCNGTPTVVFFYPAAMTYGCTKEACSFRDLSARPTFTGADKTELFRVIGVSSDTVERQAQFAQKNNLNYTLLSDPEKVARKAFKVDGTALLGLTPQRVTFIIDGKGTIRAVEDSSISMAAHSKLAEKWADTLQKENSGNGSGSGSEP